jgi:hypothetical protein
MVQDFRRELRHRAGELIRIEQARERRGRTIVFWHERAIIAARARKKQS